MDRIKSIAFALLALGVALLFGSCASCGVALFTAMHDRLVTSIPVSIGQRVTTEFLIVDPDNDIRITVHAEIRTRSFNEEVKFGKTEFEPRYRFPVSYKIYSEGQRSVFSESTAVAWNSSSRTLSSVGPSPSPEADTVISVNTHLQSFAPPVSGKVQIEFEIQPDTEYGAIATGLELRVYDSVARENRWFGGSFTLFSLGWACIIIGGLLLMFRGFIK